MWFHVYSTQKKSLATYFDHIKIDRKYKNSEKLQLYFKVSIINFPSTEKSLLVLVKNALRTTHRKCSFKKHNCPAFCRDFFWWHKWDQNNLFEIVRWPVLPIKKVWQSALAKSWKPSHFNKSTFFHCFFFCCDQNF